MRKILLITIYTLLGCEGKHPEVKVPPPCGVLSEGVYIESQDPARNDDALTYAGNSSTFATVQFEPSEPSKTPWLIENKKLFFGDEMLDLVYENSVNNWNVVNNTGNIVGLLKAFRTEKCLAVTQLGLTMYLPREDALSFITYLSL